MGGEREGAACGAHDDASHSWPRLKHPRRKCSSSFLRAQILAMRAARAHPMDAQGSDRRERHSFGYRGIVHLRWSPAGQIAGARQQTEPSAPLVPVLVRRRPPVGLVEVIVGIYFISQHSAVARRWHRTAHLSSAVCAHRRRPAQVLETCESHTAQMTDRKRERASFSVGNDATEGLVVGEQRFCYRRRFFARFFAFQRPRNGAS